MSLVVCADHDTPIPTIPGTEVVAIAGLCGDPGSLVAAELAEVEAVMLHAGEFDRGFLQGALRKRGADPLGVPVVELAGPATEPWLTVAAAGALARHRAFPGSGPEHAKMRWPELLSRRRLFAMTVPQYIAAPAIDRTTCAAERGCRLCVDACPSGALRWDAGQVSYDMDLCVACGICTTTCPTGATTNPTATTGQVAAQIRAIVEASDVPVGIEYRCRDAVAAPPVDGWFPVEVPCTGMLTVGWLLAPLVLGAGAIGAPSCTDIGCELGNDLVLKERRKAAGAILDELGSTAERLHRRSRPMVPDPLGSGAGAFGESWGDAEAFLALADALSVDDAVVEAGSAGVVAIDAATCTACEQCTSVCPSTALRSGRIDGEIEITVDPLLCVGCGACVATCPERAHGAITLERCLDVAELVLGRRTVRSATTATCEVCRGPIAPSAMLERIRSMLGPDLAGTVDLISRRCLNCR